MSCSTLNKVFILFVRSGRRGECNGDHLPPTSVIPKRSSKYTLNIIARGDIMDAMRRYESLQPTPDSRFFYKSEYSPFVSSCIFSLSSSSLFQFSSTDTTRPLCGSMRVTKVSYLIIFFVKMKQLMQYHTIESCDCVNVPDSMLGRV